MKFARFEKTKAMIRLVLIVAVLISIQHYSVAQDLMAIDNYMDKLRIENVINRPNQLSYSDIAGTPYYDDTFRKGILFLKSGRRLSGEFRYDIYADMIEFRKGENIFTLGIPDSIAKIEVENAVYSYQPYYINSDIHKSYFITIEDGYYTLLEKTTRLFRKAEPPGPYQDAPKPARFEDGGTELFLMKGDEPAVRVANIRDIISVCGEDGSLASEYIDTNKIRFRNTEGLRSLVNHLNNSIKR